MNPAAVLALIADLYTQLKAAQEEIARLAAELQDRKPADTSGT